MALRMRSRRRWLLAAAAGLWILAAGDAARAVTISLAEVAPTPSPILPESSIFVELQFSGLVEGDAPSLTSFEIDVAFDDALLDFVDLAWDPLLGQTCTLETFDSSCDTLAEFSSSTGLVELGASSLLDPATINANQPASGVLATIQLQAAAVGTSALTLPQVVLGGTITGTQEGTLSATASGLTLVVTPEPGTLGLLLLGLAALRSSRLRR